jgi:hypothetical protein
MDLALMGANDRLRAELRATRLIDVAKTTGR